MLLPTIPAPMTTTLARSGSVAMPRVPPRPRPSGQVDHDGLELGQALERIAPADPPGAAPRPGATAERQVRLPVVRALVAVHPSGPRVLGERQPAPKVLRED